MKQVPAPRDWDADTYDRVSNIQLGWGLEVLERLDLEGHETVLDAGCGSGRVTLEIAQRLSTGRVIAVDSSASMVAKARAALGPGARVEVADLSELDLGERVDAVFSNAVFHWIADHARLFERLHAALRPGGRLVAQCGGAGNLDVFLAHVHDVSAQAPYAEHLDGWALWHFPTAEQTAQRLAGAGLTEVECWLERRAMQPAEPGAYVRAVNLGAHLERLPVQLREPFVEAVLARVPAPLTLDYVRLNIDARVPA